MTTSRKQEPGVGTVGQRRGRVTRYRDSDIAVVGIACQYPGAPDKDALWERLLEGWDPVRPFPASRRADVEPWFTYASGYPDLKLEFTIGAYLERIDRFDPKAFKMTPREAELMDPAQRLFLASAVGAIEDAGYGGGGLEGTRTGVFVGFAPDFRACNYKDILLQMDRRLAPLILQANLTPMMPARVAYLLDLQGPAICVDTACSSSLVAVHLACASIRKGESSAAIAGGVKLNLLPLVADVKVGIESDDGYTRPFDDAATGTGVGEGVGAVLLKPLARAVQDGDHIYAVVRGSAVGQDGRSAGITAPDPAAQADTLISAWRNADIDPETLDWIEAHGTATTVGDPVELTGMTMAFRRFTARRQFCAVSSIKGSTNHLFEGAGITGFIRACLSLEHETLTPSTRFETPNRAFDFADSPIYVNTEVVPWPRRDRPRLCGVNAFGMSGTNCHLVLEEAPTPPARTSKPHEALLVLSAADRGGLLTTLVRFRDHLRAHPALRLEDVCFTAAVGRVHREVRAAIIASSLEELVERLDSALAEDMNLAPVPWCYHTGANLSPEFGEDGGGSSLQNLARRYVYGETIDWAAQYRGANVRRVSLPLPVLQQVRCWYEPPAEIVDTWRIRNRMHYHLRLEEEPRPDRSREVRHALLLVHPDSSRIVLDLERLLQERGATVRTATVRSREDAEALVAQSWFPELTHIVHLQTVGDRFDGSWQDVLEGERLGIRTLYWLMGAAGNRLPDPLELVLVVDRATRVDQVDSPQRAVAPCQSALVAMGRVIDREETAVRCSAIDVGQDTGAETLLAEVEADAETYFRVCRGDRRYVEVLTALDPEAVDPEPLPVQPDGVYLITGGTGGLGLEMARYLADRGAVNFALLSRRGMIDRSAWPRVIAAKTDVRLASRVTRLEALVRRGCRIDFPVADVSDPEAVAAAAERLTAKFGRINGIIHCAGVPSEGLLADKPLEAFDQVVAPKTRGGWLMHNLAREVGADFLILFSSVATMLPAVGQADYAAGNGYLDGLALAARGQNPPVFSLNWVAWREVGMAADTGVAEDSIVKALSPDQALQAGEVALERRWSPVLIGALNYDDTRVHLLEKLPIRLSDAIRGQLESRGGAGARTLSQEGQKPTPEVRITGREAGGYSPTERAVAAIWGEALGYDVVPVAADFYELGGDSIQAMRILNAIQDQFGVSLRMQDVLSSRTVEEVAALLDEKLGCSGTRSERGTVPIPRAPAADAYPLSAQQRRMYTMQAANPESITYNMPVVYRVHGALDLDRFQAAVTRLVARHEALRTGFFDSAEGVEQRVMKSVDLPVSVVPLAGDLSPAVRRLIRPFRLDEPPLYRVAVLEHPDGGTSVFFDAHHIVADGASMAILLEDLASAYAGVHLEPLPISYTDYAVWQQSEQGRKHIAPHERYWQGVIDAGLAPVVVPRDSGAEAAGLNDGARVPLVLESALIREVDLLAEKMSSTRFSVLLTAYAALLARYTGSPVVPVGIPVSGRTDKSLERIVGLFVNTLLLRLEPGFDRPLETLVREVGEVVAAALDHQDYQFDDLLRRWRAQSKTHESQGVTPAPAGRTHDLVPEETPLTTLFVLQNQAFRPLEIPDLRTEWVPVESGTAKVDIAVELVEQAGGTTGWIEYRRAYYRESTMERMARDYQAVVAQLVANPRLAVGDLDLNAGRVVLGQVSGRTTGLEDIEFDL